MSFEILESTHYDQDGRKCHISVDCREIIVNIFRMIMFSLNVKCAGLRQNVIPHHQFFFFFHPGRQSIHVLLFGQT